MAGTGTAGEVSFVELGVEDAGRGRVFYAGLFGWSFTPGPSGEGWVVDMPSAPAGMHGGDRGASPYVFFRVDDLDAAADRVRELGGQVDDAGPGGDEADATFGRFRLCTDDQGSRFGLHEPPRRSADLDG